MRRQLPASGRMKERPSAPRRRAARLALLDRILSRLVREWQPRATPEKALVHDFPSDAIGKAILYGVYDMGRNEGMGQRRPRPRHCNRRS